MPLGFQGVGNPEPALLLRPRPERHGCRGSERVGALGVLRGEGLDVLALQRGRLSGCDGPNGCQPRAAIEARSLSLADGRSGAFAKQTAHRETATACIDVERAAGQQEDIPPSFLTLPCWCWLL